MFDADLVRQAIAGRPGACADLARRWAGCVVALCQAQVGQADADELALRALRRALQEVGTLDEPVHFGRRLCALARDLCLDRLQSRQGSPALNGHAPPLGEDTLPAEVEGLPETYREVLMLRYIADAGYREIADLLEATPATVRVRLARARALLRESPAGSGGTAVGPSARPSE